MTNRYSRALKQIKDKTLDEKLQLLSEIPTNNSSGLYTDTPGYAPPEETVAGDIDTPLDLDQDGDGEEGYEGKDTTGLFMENGTIRTIEPPGDTSYVLGPMISMWYAWANYTQIGYVRQSDRRMVNLGRITGELADWDEESGFTSYGQLTLEQAVWYKGQARKDYRAFYPGPPSNPADEYGRYIGSIVMVSKSTTRTIPQNPYLRYVAGTRRGFNATDNVALMASVPPAAQIASLFVLMIVGFGAALINTILRSISPEDRERLFDRSTSQFGDTNAAGKFAEKNIGSQVARIWQSKTGAISIHYSDYVPSGKLINEQASGGGTITAHTDAGDVTINLPKTPLPMPPQDSKGMQTTPETGVATDYSKRQLNWLKGQDSEYFVAGFISNTEPARLEKMFAGTTVSWYQVARMNSEIKEIDRAKDEAMERWSEIYHETQPQIESLLQQTRALLNIPEWTWAIYGRYMPLSNEIDRLFDLRDAQLDLHMSLAKQSLEMSGRLGRYVQSGKLADPDPFKLNDPTIKKEKELDEKEISDLINQLKSENSELKQRILLNKLKAFGYGALLLAGAVVGFKLLMGGAGLKALGAPVVNQLKKLAPKVKPIKTPKPTSSLDDGLDQLLKNMPISGKPKPTMAQQSKIDAFHRVVGDPKTLTRATDAVSKAPSGFKNEVAIEIVVQGKKIMVKAADILRNKGFQVNSHQPSGKLLTESQKRVIRNIKKPVQVKEIPSKVKVSPKLRNKNKTVGADMMKTPNVPNQFKPPAPNIWASKDRKANIRASQEKKNEVLELVGAAEHHWTYLTEQKRREHQGKVNEMMSAEFDKQMELLYEKYKSKESKLDKTISAFRKPTDVAPEYPKAAPPEMDPETGMHPKYGKKYKHDKLDPHSAEAMPPTGDPVIDANIKKATNAKEKARKLKILMGKTKRG